MSFGWWCGRGASSASVPHDLQRRLHYRTAPGRVNDNWLVVMVWGSLRAPAPRQGLLTPKVQDGRYERGARRWPACPHGSMPVAGEVCGVAGWVRARVTAC